MVFTGRPASDHLSFLRRSAEFARRFSVFALLRQAEARARDLPPIGRSKLPQQNVVDLAHSATLDFPGSTVEGIEFGRTGRPRIRTLFLGLTGPMGALPLHLTEFIHYERHYAPSQPFGRFLDLLTDRMLQFFYRAWADAQPAVTSDRPAEDRFAGYIASLAGIKKDLRSGFPFTARIPYAGLFATGRSPAVLVDCLSHFLRTRVSSQEFIARWREIAPMDHTRIGTIGAVNVLGQGAVLGRRVRVIDDTYRIRMHCADMAEYSSYLPISPQFFVVQDVLETLVPPQLEWQLRLELDERKIDGVKLDGTMPLGWAAWMAPQRAARVRADAKLGHKPVPAGSGNDEGSRQ